jgi:hypothetical protein
MLMPMILQTLGFARECFVNLRNNVPNQSLRRTATNQKKQSVKP